jgi:DNA-binding transcriptional MerR regulator
MAGKLCPLQRIYVTNQEERVEHMQNNKILRAYSIKEVSKKINIPTGTIRQWEKDLQGILVIPRTKQGARFFTENEIELLKKIKEMRQQNVSKEMIRSLLQKHFTEISEPPSESNETSLPALDHEQNEVANTPEFNIEDFYTMMESYKQELVKEIKQEISYNRQQIMDEMKNELASSSLHSIKEISKSIQRSNDKRKGELQEISGAITQASEYTSESFETLAEQVANTSQGTYERIAKKINETSKVTSRENNATLRKVSKTLDESKKDMERIAHSFEAKQEMMMDSMNELKQFTEEIQHREEVFQGMLSSYREVAASKAKKKTWWKLW